MRVVMSGVSGTKRNGWHYQGQTLFGLGVCQPNYLIILFFSSFLYPFCVLCCRLLILVRLRTLELHRHYMKPGEYYVHPEGNEAVSSGAIPWHDPIRAHMHCFLSRQAQSSEQWGGSKVFAHIHTHTHTCKQNTEQLIINSNTKMLDDCVLI